jgi:hypothetical protein
MKRLLILSSLLALDLHLPAAEKVSRPIRVAVYQGPGAGPSRTNLLDALAAAKGAPGLQVVQLSTGLVMFRIFAWPVRPGRRPCERLRYG